MEDEIMRVLVGEKSSSLRWNGFLEIVTRFPLYRLSANACTIIYFPNRFPRLKRQRYV